ncbi:hypothetical protein [Mangrovimonas xylaniphaga]|uniref:hypothetical protein n=1 Tax=Mangrovimonas xylaniphaga TaxID=1645915 RepID=UPI0006B4719D|nr:hypothetical protein [Mangrovimonas xylaniphaga]
MKELKQNIDSIKTYEEELKSFFISSSELSDAVKTLAQSISISPSPLIVFQNTVRDSFAKININSYSTNEFLSELEFLKSLGEYKLLHSNRFLQKKALGSKYNSLLNKLKKKSINDLFKFYENEENLEIKEFIGDYIIQHLKILSYQKLIKKISSWIKKIQFLLSSTNRNHRFFLRKIISFLFKNLDDYHENTVIQNFEFKAVQPFALILNNSYYEKQYFRKN